MDKINEITKQFINTSNFYIREIKKGKDKISNIYLELLNGSNNVVPCFIHTKDNKVLSNIIVERNKKDLELQVISSEIYNLFNVFAPLSFYLYNDEGSRAVLEINPQNEREIYCSSYELITNLVNEVKRGIITIPSYLKDYLTILRDNKELINDIDIIKLIEISINALDRKYALKDKDKERLLKNFLELIIVDYITLNNNRNTDTYAFLINKVNDKINVTPSYLKRLNINKEDYSLNGIIVKYNNLLKVLFNNYYDYIKLLVKSMIDNRNIYEKCINLIVDANSSEDRFSTYKNKC